jgi:hypothetical protein
MNAAELEKKLLAAARAIPPDDRVPLAFERRIMALVRSKPLDELGWWVHWLWRGAAASVAVVLLLSAASFLLPARGAASADLSQDFEQTMLAAVDVDAGL